MVSSTSIIGLDNTYLKPKVNLRKGNRFATERFADAFHPYVSQKRPRSDM